MRPSLGAWLTGALEHMILRPDNLSSTARRWVAAAALLLGLPSSAAFASDGVVTVLKDYLRAVYSQDAETAYGLLSSADQDVKTEADYAQEIGAFDGPALVVAKALAEQIDFGSFNIDGADDHVDVTFDVMLPNANDPAIKELLHGFSADRLSVLAPAQIDDLLAGIQAMKSAGELPMLKSEGEVWTLVRENDQWRVFENWAEAVEVTFDALTFHDLPWEFEPLRTRVMAQHGETIHMAYRAKNLGDKDITAKARHIIGPDDAAAYLDIIACFCFLEETLAPGEETELPLTFRVDFEAPEDITAFNVRYEFYPAEQFPGEVRTQ